LEPKQKLKKLLSGRSNFGISEVYGTKKIRRKPCSGGFFVLHTNATTRKAIDFLILKFD
jgi:hypothetical protein